MNAEFTHYQGIAPRTNVVMVKAFGERGEGSYANVIRGIDWIVHNRERLGIRVLNLSFSAPARSHYWDDPVNQAVMRAWQAGIFVVASAGNTGPSPMTIGVPGNVPYVLTVGAMTDSYTPDDRSDDRLTTFSAAGPTAERFVTGQYSKADLEPVAVKCPECGNKGFQPVKGRFGPVWRCTNRPACKHFFDSKPTGKRCRYETKGKKCGALMVEGTKTIPDRCSLRSCPNRNPHRL